MIARENEARFLPSHHVVEFAIMTVECPRCECSIEADAESHAEIVCPACGSAVPWAQEQTRTLVEEHWRVGKFELLEKVGSGAFGAVWQARDTELGRIVAVKIPHSGQLASDKESERFVREARSTAQLRHPGIVTVHEVGRFEHLPYIVSDFVRGQTLADYLESHKLGHRDASELVAHVADALDYAHSMGVVHRDVKPSNVMLERVGSGTGPWSGSGLEGPAGRPLLMDFGLALRADADSTMTQEGDILGTPAYMSPEQASGHSHGVDVRSDVYSLGVVLYRLLTGQLPFQGNIRVILDQVLHDEPAAPRSLDRTIPRDLATICLKAMAKVPANRYATARELAEDLRHYVAGEPIAARPVAFWERGWRWAKRRPAAATAVGLGALAILTLAGLAVALGYQSRLRAAIAEAEHQRGIAEIAQAAEKREKQRVQSALEREADLHYFNRFVLAEREWQANGVQRAESLLDECPVDRRGWEWRYLKRLCHADLMTLRGHTNELWTVAFSPDGRILATGARDGTARLWDVTTGTSLGEPLAHPAPVWTVAFGNDANRLATYSGDSKQPAVVRLWDLTRRKEVFQSPPSPPGEFLQMGLSPDGALLAWARRRSDQGDEIVLWDLASGSQPLLFQGHTGPVSSLKFSPDSRFVASATGTNDYFNISKEKSSSELKLWDAKSGMEVRSYAHTDRMILSLAFSLDGRILASAGALRTINLLDVKNGSALRTLFGHTHFINGMAFSRDGTRLASASEDGTAKLWDVASGQMLTTYRGHQSAVQDVAISPDGKLVATVAHDRTIKLWDAARSPESRTLGQFESSISALSYSPDGRSLAVGCADRSVTTWDPDTGKKLLKMPALDDSVWDLAHNRNGSLLAVATGDWQRPDQAGLASTWDLVSGQRKQKLKAHRNVCWSLAFSPDGKLLVTGGGEIREGDRRVRLWDVASGREVRTFTGHTAGIGCVAFSPDGKIVASVSGDASVRLWDVATGQEVAILRGHTGNIWCLAFSPDGRLICSGGRDAIVRLWDVTLPYEPKARELRGHTAMIKRLAFSPDGKRLASASVDQTVKLWDPASGQEVLTLRGHNGTVWAVAFSPDGEYLASGGDDQTLRIWDATPLEVKPD
jgi:eukaryotic-like serine/threonine-protein kinase